MIRETGGAYGSGTSIDFNGVFSMYSYRDPHLEKTFESFNLAVKKLLEEQIT
jgi:Zn-dependent M16 (insulinase) family peptidase